MELLSKLFRRGKPPIPELERRIAWFREVLHANNAALGFIAEIQETLEGQKPVTAARVCRMVAGVTVQTYRMVSTLKRMTDKKYSDLLPRFNDLKTKLGRKVGLTPSLKPVGLVMLLSEVGPCLADAVGEKSAYLGDAKRMLEGNVPSGFATTVEAFHAFMRTDGLGARIAEVMKSLPQHDVASCFEASAHLVQMIEGSRVPDEVVNAIQRAVASLPGSAIRVAVRSSAIQEGGTEMSFAGQYRSMLNIPADGVVDAFRRVVASKYTPEALTYRMVRGFDDAMVAMCCCVVPMVDAVAAGVLYTAFPTSSGPKTILQCVRGLGLAAVDGSTEPSTFILDRASRRVIDVKPGLQRVFLQSSSNEGTERILVDEQARETPALTPGQAVMISELGWKLESALKVPLDIEWAIDREGRPFVLQVRPLSDVTSESEQGRKTKIAGARILLEKGTRASGGAGFGAVYRVETDLDILRCPPGSVVTVREANPRFAVLLPKAAALVADMGEITGHLATVARELHVPALFATRRATEILTPGETVTVDADAAAVYAGRLDAALATTAPAPEKSQRDPNLELLRSVSDLIIPLTLRDRLASGYSPRSCKTIHDIIRFCHQATIEAMFDLGDSVLRNGHALRQLVSPVPIDCRILDLGGGLNPRKNDAKVTVEEIVCRPMRMLWKGLTDPRLPWKQTRPISIRGFMSAVVDYNFDLDARLRPMGEPSYAFVTDEYLNLNSRIGYHFSTVDARICENIESNYASFRFVGGATGIERRSRRARMIERVLAARGFETDCRADLVNARIRHHPPGEMDEALFQVGLLIGYVNHLDMALGSDAVMKMYEDAFLSGNYGFESGKDGG